MKNLILLLAVMAMVTSCGTPAEKVEKAQDNVVEANKDLQEANQAYLQEIEAYRVVTAKNIESNEKIIADFNLRIDKQKSAAKAEYQKRIAELEKKNSDMKMNIANYKEEGQENWNTFRTNFNRDMEELGKSIKEMSEDKEKK